MDVQAVDPADDAAFDGWFGVFDAACEHDRPGEPDWLRHEQQALALSAREPDAATGRLLLALVQAGRTLAAAALDLPRRDNLHLCEFELAVSPPCRRRGAGTLLEDAVADLARRHGRTTLLIYADEPPGAEGGSAGRAFGLARGYDVAQREVRRDIDLPLDGERVAALQARCAGPAAGYDVQLWVDRVPDALLADRAELSRTMSVDVPLDAVHYEEEVWDGDRIRRDEAQVQAQDRTTVSAGAVHAASGRLVAYSTVHVPRAMPRRAYQWDTLVLGAHRGHRLGTVVKLAMLQELAARSPATRYVSTWNAQENAHMIAINDALGARTNGQLLALQRLLA